MGINLRYTTTSKTMGGCRFVLADIENKRLIYGQSAAVVSDLKQEFPFEIEVSQKKMKQIIEYYQGVGFSLIHVNDVSDNLADIKYNNLDILYGKA